MKRFILLSIIQVITLLSPFCSELFAQQFENIAPAQNIQHSVNTELLFGGHGVSFYDFDNDGWDDITFIQENDSVILYKNVAGTFQLIPSIAFQSGEIRQALWVDYDNDGNNDLFVTATNGLAKLYRNDGDFNFEDVSVQAGLSEFISNNYGVTFADYNLDGFLDFYLTRYQMEGSEEDPSKTNALYRNNGNGTFTDVTLDAGVTDSVQPSFMGIWIDVNKDLLPDLYVINDRILWGNSLYLNNGDGTFTDYTLPSGTEMFGEDPMGATFGDYDNDGDLDMLLANGGPPTKPPRLYTNNGDSTFFENAAAMNIDVPVTFMCTWGGSWIDADNDSYLDLYLTTGFLIQAFGEVRNYFFINNQGSSFTDAPSLFANDHVAASYSVAKGDIDNDGCADLVVQNAKDYESFIWKNNYGPTTGNNYLKVTLEGTQSNKMAIGSWISVYCENQIFTHYTRCGESFISQDSQHHIFGLSNYNIVDSIVIDFPSGITNTYYDIDVNQHIYFTEFAPTHEITASSTSICQGDTLWIDGGDYASHNWNNGWEQRYIPVTQSGQYSVTVTNNSGIQIESNTLDISVISPPDITADINNVTCYNSNNGAIQLTIASNANSPAISWSNGSTGTSVQNLTPGSYSFNYSDEAGCSDSGEYDIFEAPEIVVFTDISLNQTTNLYELDVIIFGGTPSYTLFLDGNSIGLFHTDIQPGTYVLSIIDANGCIHEQNITFDALSITNNLESDLVTWYPNPSSNGNFSFTSAANIQILAVIDQKGANTPYSCEGEKLTIHAEPSTYHVLFLINNAQHFTTLIIK